MDFLKKNSFIWCLLQLYVFSGYTFPFLNPADEHYWLLERSRIRTLSNNAIEIIEKMRSLTFEYVEKRSHCLMSRPLDCEEILRCGFNKSGIYRIWPRSRVIQDGVDVYCDMDTDYGGWTVVQRRGDFGRQKDYFFREWLEYKRGFGNIEQDFWFGLDRIHTLTNQRPMILRFELRDVEGNQRYAVYDAFWVESEENHYKLHVRDYRGNAGDSFGSHDGLYFSTKDKDNDNHENNCAVMSKGAWWYSRCHTANLNGLFLNGSHESYADGIAWNDFKGYHYSLGFTEMKVRPLNFR